MDEVAYAASFATRSPHNQYSGKIMYENYPVSGYEPLVLKIMKS